MFVVLQKKKQLQATKLTHSVLTLPYISCIIVVYAYEKAKKPIDKKGKCAIQHRRKKKNAKEIAKPSGPYHEKKINDG